MLNILFTLKAQILFEEPKDPRYSSDIEEAKLRKNKTQDRLDIDEKKPVLKRGEATDYISFEDVEEFRKQNSLDEVEKPKLTRKSAERDIASRVSEDGERPQLKRSRDSDMINPEDIQKFRDEIEIEEHKEKNPLPNLPIDAQYQKENEAFKQELENEAKDIERKALYRKNTPRGGVMPVKKEEPKSFAERERNETLLEGYTKNKEADGKNQSYAERIKAQSKSQDGGIKK